MGTNYHFVPSEDNPLRVFGSIHLGKSSMGWSFGFHGYKVESGVRCVVVESGLSIPVNIPGLWITSFAEVVRLLESGGEIENEYGEKYTVERFVKMVEDKKAGQNQTRSYPDDRSWIDSDGNSFGNYEFC